MFTFNLSSFALSMVYQFSSQEASNPEILAKSKKNLRLFCSLSQYFPSAIIRISSWWPIHLLKSLIYTFNSWSVGALSSPLFFFSFPTSLFVSTFSSHLSPTLIHTWKTCETRFDEIHLWVHVSHCLCKRKFEESEERYGALFQKLESINKIKY